MRIYSFIHSLLAIKSLRSSAKASAVARVDRLYKQTVVSLDLLAVTTSNTPQIKNTIPSHQLAFEQTAVFPSSRSTALSYLFLHHPI